jgi:hypothetical protein
MFYDVMVGGQTLLVKVVHLRGAGRLGSGDPVGVLFDEGSLHLVGREAAP